MTHLTIDTQTYDYQINEQSSSKDGYFGFDGNEITAQIRFTSDEYGNVKTLNVMAAYDDYGNDTSYTIDDSDYQAIADQIEPMLWGESEAYETEHGLRNSDLISDWA